jgi:hypothetical protein
MFYDHYIARGNSVSELTEIARSHGYDNPGPIVCFPPNSNIFPPAASPVSLPPKAQVLIPWHPNVLRKLIATEQYLIVEVTKSALELMEEQHQSKEEMEQFLGMIDAVCMLIQMGRGIGFLVHEAATEALKGASMTSKQLVAWFITSRIETAVAITTLAIPAPSEPKRDFRFVIRMTLGPTTPSYWASAWAAWKSGDFDTFLYGPAAIEYKTNLQIKRHSDIEIGRLRNKLKEAQQQIGMPFYAARV